VAAATAALSSAELASGTSDWTFPVAGLKILPVRPEAPATARPLIQWGMLRSVAADAAEAEGRTAVDIRAATSEGIE
jgi:hypothetical protein